MIQILRAVHDGLGHNFSTSTYMIVQRLYYWKGLKASFNKHIKQFMTCQKKHTSSRVCSTALFYPEVYAKFGGSVKILSNNGMKFKKQLFTDVAT